MTFVGRDYDHGYDTGRWSSDCESVSRSGKYARFYSFSVGAAWDVRIGLSPSEDSYMVLL